MKRFLGILLLLGLGGGCAFGQATARQESLVMDTRKSENLTVNHKAYSAIQFNGTVTDSVANAAINITGKTGSIGFKTSRSATTFFAQIGITVTDGAKGQWSGTLPAAQWATNILVKTRFYGDLLLSDFGNPLPSIDLWLYPSANQGTETNYVAPTSAGFETNLTLVAPLNRISFDSGFAFIYTAGNTNRLRISVPAAAPTLQDVADNGATATNTLTMGGVQIPSELVVDQTNWATLPSLSGTGDNWQSITVGKSGILTNFWWQLSGVAGAVSGNIYVYEGEGTGGTLLYSAATYFPGSITWQYFTCNVPIEAQAQYTIRVDGPTQAYDPLNHYAGGRSSISATDDMLFTTLVYTASQSITPGGGALSLDTVTVGRVRGNLVPDNATRTVGTPTDPWLAIYLAGSTIYMSDLAGGDATNAVISFDGTNIVAHYPIADTSGVTYASTNWVIEQGYLDSADIGVTVQGYSATLAELAETGALTNFLALDSATNYLVVQNGQLVGCVTNAGAVGGAGAGTMTNRYWGGQALAWALPGDGAGYSTRTNGTHSLEHIAFDDGTLEYTDWERFVIPPRNTNFAFLPMGYGAVTGTVQFVLQYAVGMVAATTVTSTLFDCEGTVAANSAHEWSIDISMNTNIYNALDIRWGRQTTNTAGNIAGDYYVSAAALRAVQQ